MYKKLLLLYPREFRDQLSESMEQTFNDLCRERHKAGEPIVTFALWTFADTLLGIIKEKFKYMKTKSKVTAITAVLLIGVLIILGVVWWVNGRNDTWLYATSALIVLSSFVPMFSGVKKDKNQ